MVSGIGVGTIGGAVAGAQVGGIYGAAAGAIIGGAASAAGGMMDYANLIKRQEENKKYATDMYSYNLQNIQAIPTSLTKSTALTYNVRFWPFVEYYTCTDTEKQVIRDKITYDGMTVMAIGYIRDYVGINANISKRYVKGQMIRLENFIEDSHVADAIYDEINKGIYFSDEIVPIPGL